MKQCYDEMYLYKDIVLNQQIVSNVSTKNRFLYTMIHVPII